MVDESIQGKIDRLARVAVGAEPGDLSGLVELSELAGEIADTLMISDLAALSALARRIKCGVESIVLRETESPEQALSEAHRAIDELQRASAKAGKDAAATADPAPPVDATLLSAWIAGCDGMLGELENQLLAAERNPRDAEAEAEIRRIIHTLKGECGVLALHGVQRLCHEAETLMDSRSMAGGPPPVDLLLELVDWLKSAIGGLASNAAAETIGHAELLQRIIAAQVAPQEQERGTAAAPASPPSTGCDGPSDVVACVVAPGAEENLSDFICEAREHLAGAEEALLALEHDAANRELINTVFRAFHTIKGVSGFLHLAPIVALSHRAEQVLDGARSGTLAMGRMELDVILASCDMLLKLLSMLGGAAAPARADFDALLLRLDEASAASAGAAKAAAPGTTHEPGATPGLVVPARTDGEGAGTVAPGAGPAGDAAPAPTHAKRADQTVKVSTARMDNLVTMVGELVIAQQMAAQDTASLGAAGQRVQKTLAHVQKIVRDLQELSMALRMVSLKSTFQRMTRLVRDVSIKAGKEIVCVTEGEDVELDRNVVEEITDPLVHMIRNACDHGLEPADERTGVGKPAQGRVSLKAYHSGGSIVIEIADDGRGLRREKILAKAREKGLVPADADETSIPDSEVFSLIFLPGFSTAEKVTDISGRGVGMDVVRRNIEALRGKIEIRSTPGKGTTFLLRLPLTMAIIDGMVVRVGEQRYVLPTLSIEHAFRPQAGEVSTVIGRGELVNVRGRLLPIYRLGRVLKLEESEREPTDALFVVVESATSRCALLVDEIIGQHQVVIKNLGAAGSGIRGVAGGAILGDGRVALILDIGSIVEQGARTAV
jgi:two-component system chemotaxis sensor kinase CheA